MTFLLNICLELRVWPQKLGRELEERGRSRPASLHSAYLLMRLCCSKLFLFFFFFILFFTLELFSEMYFLLNFCSFICFIVWNLKPTPDGILFWFC